MYQLKWLRWQQYATYASGAWLFNNGIIQLWYWTGLPVRDDTDALGCVLMGGEL